MGDLRRPCSFLALAQECNNETDNILYSFTEKDDAKQHTEAQKSAVHDSVSTRKTSKKTSYKDAHIIPPDLGVRDYSKLGSNFQVNRCKKISIEWKVKKKYVNKTILKKWLKGEFLNDSYTEAEQEKIAVTELVNDDNDEYGTSGENKHFRSVVQLKHLQGKESF